MLQSHGYGHTGSTTRTVYVDLTLTRSKVKLKVTEHLNFPKLPVTAHFQVYLPATFACSSKLMVGIVIVQNLGSTVSRSPIFEEFRSRKAITRVQTSWNVDISRNSNGHISVLRDTTVRWLGTLVVLQVLCMLM